MTLYYKTEPWEHQKKALEYLMPRSFGALYIKPGAGKTKIMIDLIINRGFKRTIIVATSKICKRLTWDNEILVHAPEHSILALNVSKIPGVKRPNWVIENGNLNKKTDQAEVLIVNYESIWREPFKSFLLKKYKPDCVICDESHKIKSPGSKCSKMLCLLGRRADNRFLMTGTPLAERPLDVYAQYRFLAPEIYGTNFGAFKEEYSNQILISGGIKIPDKRNPFKNLDKLKDKMYSCAFTCDVQLNLPGMKTQIIEFELSSKAELYYKELRKEGCLELEQGTLETENVLTIITREQQLCSGYLPLETPEGTIYEEVDTTRQETFKELIEGIPENEPIVIWCKYRRDIKNVKRICKDLGRKCSELSGKRDTMQSWVDGKTTILVVQISSGAEGLNELVKARYCVYYTLTPSLAQFKQSRARLKRPGQKRNMVCYVLVATMSKGKTIDQRIWEDLKNKRDVVNSIMETRSV